MAKIIPITEHFPHFLADMKESFWGDVYGRRSGRGGFLALESQRQRDRFSGWGRYKRVLAIVGIIATAITSGLRDPVRHDQAADCADPGEEFSAPRDRTCSAAGGQGGDADPRAFLRGISTRQRLLVEVRRRILPNGVRCH